MANNKHLHDNFEVNFSLKGITSILIGVYFFLLSYAYKYVLTNFLVDDHTLGMLSPQIIEIIFITLAGVFILFSSFALFLWWKKNFKKFSSFIMEWQNESSFFKISNRHCIAFYFINHLNEIRFGTFYYTKLSLIILNFLANR